VQEENMGTVKKTGAFSFCPYFLARTGDRTEPFRPLT
jgi:hypothetical protein